MHNKLFLSSVPGNVYWHFPGLGLSEFTSNQFKTFSKSNKFSWISAMTFHIILRFVVSKTVIIVVWNEME